MGILSTTFETAGQVGAHPRRVKIVTTDNLATVTTAGYLNNQSLVPNQFYPTDIVDMTYSFNESSGVGTYDTFTLSISNGQITLSAFVSPSDVDLPVKDNHMAVFDGTSGKIKDDAATAINGGNIQAGLSGTAGKVTSFPATAAKGSLSLEAVDNTGDTATTISNAPMGQTTKVNIPDPGGVTANFALAPAALVDGQLVKASGTAGLLQDVGAALLASDTAAYGGGGTSNAYTATGLTATSIVTATIVSQTNAASIVSAVPSTDTLTVTFSADPGANTVVSYIALSKAV